MISTPKSSQLQSATGGKNQTTNQPANQQTSKEKKEKKNDPSNLRTKREISLIRILRRISQLSKSLSRLDLGRNQPSIRSLLEPHAAAHTPTINPSTVPEQPKPKPTCPHPEQDSPNFFFWKRAQLQTHLGPENVKAHGTGKQCVQKQNKKQKQSCCAFHSMSVRGARSPASASRVEFRARTEGPSNKTRTRTNLKAAFRRRNNGPAR